MTTLFYRKVFFLNCRHKVDPIARLTAVLHLIILTCNLNKKFNSIALKTNQKHQDQIDIKNELESAKLTK